MTTLPVWQDLDQETLDRAYDQTVWAPNAQTVMARYASRSEVTRQRLGAPRRLAYGHGPKEALDFFSCARTDAPLLVFIHGGAWRAGSAQGYAFVAQPFVAAGVHVAIPDFDWVQDHGGLLGTLAQQVGNALDWLAANAASLGVDPQRVHLVGHSSGAHLAAVVATGMDRIPAAPRRLRGLVCCSGMYELEPVRRSARSRYLTLDDVSVATLSPARHAHRLGSPVVVAYGGQESPQFQWQAHIWHAAAEAAGHKTHLQVETSKNHFEILETLVEPTSPLGQATFTQIAGPA